MMRARLSGGLCLLGRQAALRFSHSLPCALEDSVYKYITKECKVKPGSRLVRLRCLVCYEFMLQRFLTAQQLLCVSGGSDSMCLLHVLMAVRGRFTPAIAAEVVHFNHKLRPESNEEVCLRFSLSE